MGKPLLKLARNFLWLCGAEVFSKVTTFIAFAYLARIAGPDGYGCVEFALAAFLCAGLIVDWGFGPLGAREIAKAPERTGQLATEIVVARFLLAVVACALMLVAALGLDRSPLVTRLLVVYGVGLFGTPLLLQWVFQGHDRMQSVATANVIRQALFAGVVIFFVRTSAQIWYVAVAEIVGVGGAAAYCLRTYRRMCGRRLRFQFVISKRLLREASPIGCSQVFWAVRMFGATMILGLVVGQSDVGDVGLFGGALRILVALHTFVWLYYFNLLPSCARAWQKGPQFLADLVGRSMHGVTWLGAGAGVVWVLLAPRAMTLAYGDEFVAGGVVLQCFALVGVLAAVGGHFRFSLVAAGKQTAEMAMAAVGALVAVALIPLGYHMLGLVGAAWGLVVAEGTVWLGAWCCARHVLGLTGQARHLIRPGIAVVVAVAVLQRLPSLPDAAKCAAALMIVLFVALVLDRAVRNGFRNALALRRALARPVR